MQFFTNIEGKVRNTILARTKPLLPLFEVVSNSIHAVEETGKLQGSIVIEIVRKGAPESLAESSNVDQYSVTGFIVKDNGVGFTQKNFESFLTSDSDYKMEKGGKGVGRFLCLKAFDQIEVESVYRDNGGIKQRSFVFKPKGEGIFEYRDEMVGSKDLFTKIQLVRIKEDFQEHCPRGIHILAQNLIEHFLIYFLTETCPKIVLIDGNGNSIDLNNEYKLTIRDTILDRNFEIKGKTFSLSLLKLYNNISSHHIIHFCANERSVHEEKLTNYIVDIGAGKITDEHQNKFVFQCYLSGEFLNERVNSERTSFNIEEKFDSDVKTDISMAEIREATAKVLEELLKEYLDNVREAKLARIKDYVKDKAPQFSIILKYKSERLSEIPPTISDNKLNIELFKIQNDLELEIKEKGEELTDKGVDITNFKEYKEKYETYIEQFNDIGKANLAKYIVHRKSVIELLDFFIGKLEDEKFTFEDTIHNIFFPIKSISDEISYDKQNLWLIDERLTYHNYLSSDLSLKGSNVINSISDDRVDLLIFNDAFAFVNDDAPYHSFVIVEFKRPERKDYNEKDEKKNPIDQIISYIRVIKSSQAIDRRGKVIIVGERNIPFYAYVVCDFNNKLLEILDNKNFKKTPDGLGYFYFHEKYDAYIEVISYQKLLSDAKKRNRVLFDKLGLNT